MVTLFYGAKPRYTVFMKKICLFLLCFLTACSTVSREEYAHSIVSSAGLAERKIVASPFILTSFERVRFSGQEMHIYIEGDGLAWAGRSRPSLDPTPKNPVALKLAAQDIASNVVYLARPCQYSKLVNEEGRCPQKYWTSHRFAPEVIESYDAALNDIKKRYDVTFFHLVGFSGGANVAALLAARRYDIASLRSVAGNLDHVLLHQVHGVSQIPASLNAKDQAGAASHIPQYHFIGGQDEIVPPSIVQSYIEAAGRRDCIYSAVIAGASHSKGWAERWPSLLQPSTTHPRLH